MKLWRLKWQNANLKNGNEKRWNLKGEIYILAKIKSLLYCYYIPIIVTSKIVNIYIYIYVRNVNGCLKSIDLRIIFKNI